MCRAMEEMRDESLREGVLKGARAKALESARSMLADGMPYEKIAKYVGLSIEEVKALDSKQPA